MVSWDHRDHWWNCYVVDILESTKTQKTKSVYSFKLAIPLYYLNGTYSENFSLPSVQRHMDTSVHCKLFLIVKKKWKQSKNSSIGE